MIDPGSSRVGQAQRVADLVRGHLEEDRLPRRRAHRHRLGEVDPDREADHAGVVHVQVRVAERPVGACRGEPDHDVGAFLSVLPAQRLHAERFSGHGVPVVHRAAHRRLEGGVRRRGEVDGEREAVPRMADAAGWCRRSRRRPPRAPPSARTRAREGGGPERARARASAADGAPGRDTPALRQRAGDHDDGPIRVEVGPRRLVHLGDRDGPVVARVAIDVVGAQVKNSMPQRISATPAFVSSRSGKRPVR